MKNWKFLLQLSLLLGLLSGSVRVAGALWLRDGSGVVTDALTWISVLALLLAQYMGVLRMREGRPGQGISLGRAWGAACVAILISATLSFGVYFMGTQLLGLEDNITAYQRMVFGSRGIAGKALAAEMLDFQLTAVIVNWLITLGSGVLSGFLAAVVLARKAMYR